MMPRSRNRAIAIALSTILSIGFPSSAVFADAVTTRLGGENRYATMGKVVSEGFSNSKWAIVVTGGNYPDALSASALAGVFGCPIILTSSTYLSVDARSQLSRLGVTDAIVVGGPSSVSEGVVSEIDSMGVDVTRLSGTNRYGTCETVMRAVHKAGSMSDTVVICTGEKFADSLSIGPWAWRTSSPVALARGGRLTDGEIATIRSNENITRVLIVGGTASVSDTVMSQLGDSYSYERLSGPDRYSTSVRVAEWACGNGLSWNRPAVATGENFPDALAGAALQGKVGSPLLLVSESSSSEAAGAIAAHGGDVSSVTVLGSESSVSAQVSARVSGSNGSNGANDQAVKAFEDRRASIESARQADSRFGGNMMDMRLAAGDYATNLISLADDLYAFLLQQPGIDTVSLKTSQDAWSASLDGIDRYYTDEIKEQHYSGNTYGIKVASAKAAKTNEHLDELFALARSL